MGCVETWSQPWEALAYTNTYTNSRTETDVRTKVDKYKDFNGPSMSALLRPSLKRNASVRYGHGWLLTGFMVQVLTNCKALRTRCYLRDAVPHDMLNEARQAPLWRHAVEEARRIRPPIN